MFRRLLISILLIWFSLPGEVVEARQLDYRRNDHQNDRQEADTPAPKRAALRIAQTKYSLDQAVSKVRRTFRVKELLKAETRGKVHHIKVLMDNGRVRTVRVDANSGRIL